MTADFDRAVALILAHEGGYANDPNDPGGETNFGISKRAYPTEDIAHLTADRAAAIYRRDYWTPLQCDALPWALAVQVFDHGVNAGCSGAVKLLQGSLGVADDGVIGPITLERAAASNWSHAVTLARRRIRYYSGLRQWDRYGDSWTQRTLDTLVEAVR
jgi:Putative secretion activating protein